MCGAAEQARPFSTWLVFGRFKTPEPKNAEGSNEKMSDDNTNVDDVLDALHWIAPH
jgi:hypothetical protein